MIGDRLKEERERLGLTQPAFAEIAGVSKRTVIDWQNGVSSPTATQLAALMAAGLDGAYLLTGLRARTYRRMGAIGVASDLLQNAGAPKEVGEALMPALVDLISESGADLSGDEEALLNYYRRCTENDQQQVLRLAERLASPQPRTKGKGKSQ